MSTRQTEPTRRPPPTDAETRAARDRTPVDPDLDPARREFLDYLLERAIERCVEP